jgi:hypothetical protein
MVRSIALAMRLEPWLTLPSRASSFETPLRGPQDEELELELLPLFARAARRDPTTEEIAISTTLDEPGAST